MGLNGARTKEPIGRERRDGLVDKIGGYPGLSPLSGTPNKRDFQKRDDHPEEENPEEGQQETGDDASLVAVQLRGIPAEHLSPEVQQAFVAMMQDFDRLRAEVSWGRDRVRQLERLADHHDQMPMYNRRAFLRKIGDAMAHQGHFNEDVSLMLVHVGIGDAVRRTLGLKAHGELMDHVAGVLTGLIHPTDLIAALGGHDFGVLLMVGDPKTAEAKRRTVIEGLNRQPFIWLGHDYHLKPLSGLATLDHPEGPIDALWEADRDLTERAKTNHHGDEDD